jgi:hypothetical protein
MNSRMAARSAGLDVTLPRIENASRKNGKSERSA